MKKLTILTLCFMLLATVAFAGTVPLEIRKLSDTKTLVFEQPESVLSLEIEDVYDMKLITFELADAAMPQYYMVVSYSDLLHEQDITDLTDEQIAELVAQTAADSENHSYEVIEMDDGWPAVLVKYDDESDWVDAFTVISGYLIQIHGAHEDFSTLTDAEDTFAFTLLDCIDIVDAE